MKRLVTATFAAALAAGPAGAATPLNYMETFGPAANPVTALTWGLSILSVLVVVIITALVLIGTARRRSPAIVAPYDHQPLSEQGNGLKALWISVAVSGVGLVGTLVWTIVALVAVNGPRSAPGLTVEVTGEQWWWAVRYPSDQPTQVVSTANEIHIPVGVPVRVKLDSADVIHSFWVPALAGKTDTIPGRTNFMWLQADKAGVYRGQCTEYCGLQHAHMAFTVVAEAPDAFNRWRTLQRLSPAPPAGDLAAAQGVFVQKCGACHTVRGSLAGGSAGPDLTHVMSRQTLAAGTLPNTENNLAGWIANPQALKPGTKMPNIELTPEQLFQVTSYLKTLR